MADQLPIPPYALLSDEPSAEELEQCKNILRLELEASTSKSVQASLSHQLALLSERQGQLPAAARDELAATNYAAGFIEPLEALLSIASRSRSSGNLRKLLARSLQVARSPIQTERTALQLAAVELLAEHQATVATADSSTSASASELNDRQLGRARATLESALEDSPESPALWLALDLLNATHSSSPSAEAPADDADLSDQLRSTLGRAAHARSPEMGGLLMMRAAKMQEQLGDVDAAIGSLQQAVDLFPNPQALHSLEELVLRAEGPVAAAAATRSLYQLASESSERHEQSLALTARFRTCLHLLAGEDLDGASDEVEGLLEQLSLSSAPAPAQLFALAIQLQLQNSTGDLVGAQETLERARALQGTASLSLTLQQFGLARLLGDSEQAAMHLKAARELLPTAPGVAALTLRNAVAETSEKLSSTEEHNTGQASHGTTAIVEALKGLASSTSQETPLQPADLLLAAALIELSSGRTDSATELLRSGEVAGLDKQISESLSAGVQLSVGSPAERVEALSRLLARGAVSTGTTESQSEDPLPSGNEDQSQRLTLAWHLLREAQKTGATDATKLALAHVPEVMRAELSSALRGRALPRLASAELVRAQQLLGHRGPGEAAAKASAPGDAEGASPTTDTAALADTAALVEFARRATLGLDPLSTSAPAQRTAENGEPASTEGPSPASPGSLKATTEALLDLAGALESGSGEANAELALGLKLRAILLALRERPGPRTAQRGLDLLGETPADDALPPILQWLHVAATGGDSSLATTDEEAAAPTETVVHQAWRHLKASDGAAALELLEESTGGSAAPAAALLRVLTAMAQGLETFDDLASDTSSLDLSALDAPTLGVLAFSASQLPELAAKSRAPDQPATDDSEQRSDSTSALAGARRWSEISPGAASWLTQWALGRRVRDDSAESQARSSIYALLDSAWLQLTQQISQVDETDDPALFDELLLQLRQLPDSGRPEVAWDLAERYGVGTDPLLRSRALGELASSLSAGADADAARLQAGYLALMAGEDERATIHFEALLGTLPEDATLLWGLRMAAARVGRADLEASASTALAQLSEDHGEAARLWERAAILFETELESPEEAEKAYAAALSHSPGRGYSFERLYRMAHSQGDRARLIELIDARLDAISEPERRSELLWDKARYCRALGRRSAAIYALEELLKLSPDHLPSLALSAELHLVDQRIEKAAEVLRTLAVHPDAPEEERARAGLHAADLLDRLHRPREAVLLLEELESLGVPEDAIVARRARAAARAGEWDIAHAAFARLVDQRDDIQGRLEAARMLLAIQRDHLREPEELKQATRLVLRDAPQDEDASEVALQLDFGHQERRTLLAGARQACLDALQQNPLNPLQIKRLVSLTENTGLEALERVALGAMSLTGALSAERKDRLAGLISAARSAPSAPLPHSGLEGISARGQLGAFGRFVSTLGPALAGLTLPSVEALGVTPSMRVDPFVGSPVRDETAVWTSLVGIEEHELYIGGSEPDALLMLPAALPTVVIGDAVSSPLEPVLRARLAYLAFATATSVDALVSLPLDDAETWLAAAARLASVSDERAPSREIEQRAAELAKHLDSKDKETLAGLASDIHKAGGHVTDLALASRIGCARMATLIYGSPSVLRLLRELLPEDEEQRTTLLTEVVRFALSPTFLELRQKMGLDL